MSGFPLAAGQVTLFSPALGAIVGGRLPRAGPGALGALRLIARSAAAMLS